MAKRTSGFIAGLVGVLTCLNLSVADSPTSAPVKAPSDLDYNFRLLFYGDEKGSDLLPQFFPPRFVAFNGEFRLAYFSDNVPVANKLFEERTVSPPSVHNPSAPFRLAYFNEL